MAYIEKEKISSHIRENFSIDKTKNADICFAFIDFMNWLDDQPTAEVTEVKRGHWKHLGGDEWFCTNCGEVIITEGSWEKPTKKYCNECGADMRGDTDV